MGIPGSTVAVNSIGNVSASSALSADTTRAKLVFHNPNSATGATLLLYETTDINGNTLTPTFSAPGGGYELLPGGYLDVVGAAAGSAWDALASTGTTNGLTIRVTKGAAQS